MEFIFKVFIFSVFIGVISTLDYSNSDAANKILTQLRAEHTCVETLSLPLTTILYAANGSFNEMCGQRPGGKRFFADCETQFVSDCNVRSCDNVNLMPWIQAFPKVGVDFVCTFGINNLNDIQNNGGRDCMADVGFNIADPILHLYSRIWYGQSISCGNVSNAMQHISNQLNNCDKQDLKNMVVKYFDQVVDLTPCKGQISPGSATSVSVNFLFFIVAIFASLFIFSKNQ